MLKRRQIFCKIEDAFLVQIRKDFSQTRKRRNQKRVKSGKYFFEIGFMIPVAGTKPQKKSHEPRLHPSQRRKLSFFRHIWLGKKANKKTLFPPIFFRKKTCFAALNENRLGLDSSIFPRNFCHRFLELDTPILGVDVVTTQHWNSNVRVTARGRHLGQKSPMPQQYLPGNS